MDEENLIRKAAAEHRFSEGAARAMAEALRRGGGAMAQFDHPELGGFTAAVGRLAITAGGDEVEDFLGELEGLSEDEVRELLAQELEQEA